VRRARTANLRRRTLVGGIGRSLKERTWRVVRKIEGADVFEAVVEVVVVEAAIVCPHVDAEPVEVARSEGFEIRTPNLLIRSRVQTVHR